MLDAADAALTGSAAAHRAPPVAESPAAGAAPSPSAMQLDDRLFIACGLAWGAGLIHIEVAIEHLQGYWLYAVFFALTASAQLLWGIALYRSPARRLLFAGAAMSLVVVALWIIALAGGLPIGFSPWSPGPVGALDSIASADETAMAGLMIFQLRSGRAGLLLRASRSLVAAAGVYLILLTSVALVHTGHARTRGVSSLRAELVYFCPLLSH